MLEDRLTVVLDLSLGDDDILHFHVVVLGELLPVLVEHLCIDCHHLHTGCTQVGNAHLNGQANPRGQLSLHALQRSVEPAEEDLEVDGGPPEVVTLKRLCSKRSAHSICHRADRSSAGANQPDELFARGCLDLLCLDAGDEGLDRRHDPEVLDRVEGEL